MILKLRVATRVIEDVTVTLIKQSTPIEPWAFEGMDEQCVKCGWQLEPLSGDHADSGIDEYVVACKFEEIEGTRLLHRRCIT